MASRGSTTSRRWSLADPASARLTLVTSLLAAALNESLVTGDAGATTPGFAGSATQPAPAATQSTESAPILLQLRVYSGSDEVTQGARLKLFPWGQRTTPIPMTLAADRAYEARVSPGFYDVQAIREQDDRVADIRWLEQMLVQRYPDEHGRHLQVINFRLEFGALQVRSAPGAGPAARGWSGAVFAAGDEARELARARPVGEDLLVVMAAGRYDVRITLADRTVQWLRDVEIPANGTRLKTWAPPTP